MGMIGKRVIETDSIPLGASQTNAGRARGSS